jgi:outer membrane biosynthesis protein TonB
MTVVLLGGAMFAYWKLHQKRVVPSPPAPIAVQPQPATPLPVPAPPAAPPTQPPATLTAQVEKPVSAPSEVAKKPVISKPKAPAARHEVATEPTTPTPQPQPEVVAPPPQPAPPTPSPEPVAKPEPVKLASIPRIVQVECVYGLKEATFTFSSGGQTLLQETLKGRKKGKFAVIKGAYEGTFSHTITVPAGASQVSVHVVAKDGSTDLSKTIEMPPPGGFVPTLAVDVDNEHLSLDWKSSSAPK